MSALKRIATVALVCCAFSASANAAVITFNNLAGTNMPGNIAVTQQYTNFFRATATVDGFNFRGNSDSIIMRSGYNGATDAGPYAYNGTDFLMFTNLMTVTSQTGAPFSVQSLDLKDWVNSVTNPTVTGYFSNGGTISKTLSINATYNQSINIGNDFSKYALDGFTGLNRFTITASSNWLAMDNVTVNSSAVPEPGTLAVFGLGLAGLAALRRRKQQ